MQTFEVFYESNIIKDITKDIVSKLHLCSPEEINKGECMVWALYAQSLHPEMELFQVYEPWSDGDDSGANGHVFVKWRGKYYDAMHPDGTDLDTLLKPMGYNKSQVHRTTKDQIDDEWGVNLDGAFKRFSSERGSYWQNRNPTTGRLNQ